MVEERLGDLSMAEHEGIGHMAERRDVHIRALRRDEIDEMGIDAAIFGIRRIDCRLIVEDEDLAAFRQGQTSAIVGLDGDVPGLRAFLAPVEFGGEVDAGGVGEGACRLSGKVSAAFVRKKGWGRMAVAMDKALMPGSKTPSPPGSQIQSWPGCQRRTSSFQTIRTFVARRAESHSLAGSTAGEKRECQVAKRVTPSALAAATRSSISLKVAPGGFSRITCLPAFSASRASSWRTWGGVQSATASISDAASISPWEVKLGTSSSEAERLATA